MNSEIIQKIANMFQVSFEKATELYPLIRTQYTFYTIFDFVGMIFLFVLVFIIIFGCMFFFMGFQEVNIWDKEDKWTILYKSHFKLFLKAVIALGLLIITIYVLRTLLAPDISFIRDILK